MADQTTTERFIADTSEYVRKVQEAAKDADKFGNSNSNAALAARRMGVTAAEAADRAGRAMKDAADAAQKLAREEIGADEAAKAAAKASRELERSEIAQATAAKAAAKATNELADQQRKAAQEAVAAAGMERLASLRSQGNIKDHNALLAHLRREYKGVGTDVKEMSTLAGRAWGAVSKAGTAAIGGIGSMVSSAAEAWPALLVMAAAGIIALPVAAIAAGGVITLAIGGALAGIGILAVAKSKEVKAAFSSLATDAKTQAAKWAAPFKPALVEIANSAKGVLAQLGPAMTDSFAKMAPAVERFAANLGHGLVALRPDIGLISDAFTKLLDQLGPQLPTILGSIGDGIASIAKAAGDHAAEFAQFAKAIGYAVDGLGTMVAWLINTGSAVQKFFGVLDRLVGKPKEVAAALDSVASSSSMSGAAIGALGTSTTSTYTAMELASMSADKLKAALDSLTGKAISARDAAANYAQSIFAMNKALHANGAAHGFATTKGVANEQALTNMAKAANANAEAMRNDGARTKEVGQFMEGARLRIVAAAEKMGYSKSAAEALATKLTAVATAANKIPSQKHMRVTADTAAAEAAIRHMRDLAGQPLPAAHFAANGGYIGKGYAAGGQVRGYASAGYVSGPGSSTSDSIPARLSNGEYVVNARATKQYRALLDFINYHRGGGGSGGGGRGGRRIGEATAPLIGEAIAPAIGEGTAPHGWNNPMNIKNPPHHGLQHYGSAFGQQQVVNHNYYISGSVMAENELVNLVQTKALQQGKTFSLPAGR